MESCMFYTGMVHVYGGEDYVRYCIWLQSVVTGNYDIVGCVVVTLEWAISYLWLYFFILTMTVHDVAEEPGDS